MSHANYTLAELKHGNNVIGAWLLSQSTRAAEVLSQTGIDWIGIDTEHAPYSPDHVEAFVRAIEPNATPLVRLPSVEEAVSGAAKHALDSGAQGVIVPSVETLSDAENIVQATHFPPIGERGVAGTTRANGYGEKFDDYINNANRETLVAIQIESPSAVESVEEILTVDGIDVVFIGENDLSSTLGYPGKTDKSEVKIAVERVLDAAIKNEVYPGIASRTSEIQAERANMGFQFFLLGADLTFMRSGIEEFLSK